MRLPLTPTAILSLVVLVLCASAFGLNPDRDIHQLVHRSWGEKDGYPGRAQALAQTADGFLWIGSDIGLFRFDGVHFERYVPESGDKLAESVVQGLLALPDGSLWITYSLEKRICVLRNGNVKGYGKAEGVTSGPTAIVQDREGTIWANTDTGVLRFDGSGWEHIGKNWNFPEDVPHVTSEALLVDSRGTLWAGVNDTVLYLKKGSKRFEPTGVFAGWSVSFAEAPDGTIWMADNDSYVRAISTSVSAKSAALAKCEAETPRGRLPECPGEEPLVIKIRAANDLFFDDSGGLWIGTDIFGLGRFPHPERLRNGPILETSDTLERFTSRDGLSGDNCIPIIEDREGNIWVATRDGLDQFRDTALVPVNMPTSIFRIGIAPADGGDVWVSSGWNYVGRTHGDSRYVDLIPAEADRLYRDPAGVTWQIGNSLSRWLDGRFRKVAKSPDGLVGSTGTWQATGNSLGTLWAFSNGRGFFSLSHNRWKAWTTPPEVAKQHVADMFSDSTGRIWVSTYEGDVIVMDQGSVVDYPVKPGSPLRYVKAFAEQAPQAIWAGGEGGLVLIDKGQFHPIKPASAAVKDVTGIVDAGAEGLWLNTADGVIHIPKDEIAHALRDASYRFHCERFDSFDGLPGQSEDKFPYPKATKGTDGRLWFTATRGVAWIDPKGTRRINAVPPPVDIEQIVDNGREYAVSDGLRLPPHVRDLSISYTALSLAVPEKVHFRYKLEGQDPAWREVINDRRVQYSNLAPGDYHFHVIACNNDGVWNETGASLDFSILPAYYQTAWFRALCGAAILLLLWTIYQIRLRRLHHQFTIGMEARVNERTRIARELHDTLLQSFQGAVFQFQAARKLLLRNADNAMQVVDEAIHAAEEGITEGRAAIRDLRQESAVLRNLPELLSAAGQELASSHERSGPPPNFSVIIEGEQQTLPPMLQDEVYRIAREVIRNAFAHAVAGRIEVEIRYDRDELRLRIRDDGKGIDPKILEDGGRPGHWGISGMRERAQRVGSQLDFWSEMGAGTEVQLTIPAAMAYKKRRHNRRFRLFRRAGSDEPRS